MGFSAANVMELITGSTSRMTLNSTAATFAGNIALNTVGRTVSVRTGVNAKAGTATLAAGTILIATTAITANSMIMISARRGGVVLNYGLMYEAARVAGTSFTITSMNALDTSIFDWWLVELA
jgi:hypothetical protein